MCRGTLAWEWGLDGSETAPPGRGRRVPPWVIKECGGGPPNGLRSPRVKSVFGSAPWLLLLAFPLVELGTHAWTRSHVPELADYRAAAAFVRPRLEPSDLITAAPDWTDPLVRQVIGDRIPPAMAGRSDSAGYQRAWVFSIRGARPHDDWAKTQKPQAQARFGEVTVSRYELGESRVLYHFAENLPAAEIAIVDKQRLRPCRVGRLPAPSGGGLGTGFLPPGDRIGCGGSERSVWVGRVVLEDLALQPRDCIFQPVATPNPLRVTFRDVPLGSQLVFYGGLYAEDERMRRGVPITARILIDEHPVANFVHRDGDGWKRMAVATPGGRGDVAIEVTATLSNKRRFCWNATTRSAAKEQP
jgi:hypothetical protein